MGRVVRVAAVAAASALAHVALLGAPQIRARLAAHDEPAAMALQRAAGYAARVEPIGKRIGVTMDRAALMARARAARRAGRIALGELLLDANAIDAREQGMGFDRARAGALFAARLDEVLEGMHREAEKAGLDPTWEAAFTEYFALNGLNLHQLRADGPTFSRALGRWLRDRGHADLDVYRRVVAAVDLS